MHKPVGVDIPGIENGKGSQPANIAVETPSVQSQLQDSLGSERKLEESTSSVDTTAPSQGKEYFCACTMIVFWLAHA